MVIESSARLLRLLSLLQMRQDWSGADLADRLDVTTRTVRRDVDRLRELGYPVDATVGVGGGYRLGAGAQMPPLLLDDAEVLAVAVGLQSGATASVTGLDDAAARAVAKLRQVMPSRLRHRLDALQVDTVASSPPRSSVDATVLSDLAAVCHRAERLRFDYADRSGTRSRREVEPYRLVRNGSRWYLFAWDLGRADWRSFRADRVSPVIPTGPRFTPRPLPEGGAAAHVAASLGAIARAAVARVRVHAPASEIAPMVYDEWGTIEAGDETSCEIRLFGWSIESIAWWLHRFEAGFTVIEPPGLRDECRALALRHRDISRRYLDAVETE
ncbi:DNA-binding transcriptional regulator [Williamsia sp. Leaf354]|jgi:predicted DNA-binding transcriptional regulator YafY|uniref:helix-turn-helix transcriptional regulator n=1 Tax=Williamsia sp. Leaf354 TaxID=1736349 RepID=UPI0006FB2564|nr:YafY family protein [Williamsia sp. Leaf354]KQR97888.1 DNA-binding transcriptional regulator [Williamsia sp. Leaf354]